MSTSTNPAMFTSIHWEEEVKRISLWTDDLTEQETQELLAYPHQKYRHFSGKEDVKSGYYAVSYILVLPSVDAEIIRRRRTLRPLLREHKVCLTLMKTLLKQTSRPMIQLSGLLKR
jgi:hypothetical protein